MSSSIFRSSSIVGRSARLAIGHAPAVYYTPLQLLPGVTAQATQPLVPSPHTTHSHIPDASSIWLHHVRHSSSSSGSAAINGVNSPGQLPQVTGYWGIASKEFQREDGSLWPWRSFTPSDTYSVDLGRIDVKRHHPPEKTLVDTIAYNTVKFLRKPVDLFFKNRHVSHALMLETVAAVPGMVGGMLLHLRSLRRFEHSGGWIKALLEEAENERMHLMTWVEVLRPVWWERALVLAVQGGFFNAYFLLYVASPRLAHRFVGYLEEEAVRSYTEFLEAIERGEMANTPAPLIAIDYWQLPKKATLRDVVLVIRADETHHRDVNHFAADVYTEKHELRPLPAPLGYH